MHPTKREVLRAIASIYDPLGLINPVVVMFKIFFQKLCTANLHWDDLLNESLLSEWQNLVKYISEVDEIIIDRKYVDDFKFEKVELHGFSDASDKAYGACIYLRFIYKSKVAHTRLITSKSRVNPIKKLTIPRLELMGLLLLSRLIIEVKQQLSSVYSIAKVYVWTDSSVVFSWYFNSDKRYEIFVENRLKEIRTNLTGITLKLINSSNNPADIISRGCKLSGSNTDVLWFTGPLFLNKSETEWPQLNVGDKFSSCFLLNIVENNNENSTCKLINVSEVGGANLSDAINIKKI